MKRLLSLLLSLSLILSTCACQNDSRVIGIIAKGESHAFWQSVKKGAEAAAEKYGYSISFRGPPSEGASEMPLQAEMIKTALSNNVKGLVIAAVGEGFSDILKEAFRRNIPVVEFDSGIWEKDIEELNRAGENPVIASVSTDNRKAAGLAAEKLYERLKEDIEKSGSYVLGIIQHDTSLSGYERAEGFEESFIKLAEANPSTAGKYSILREIKDGDSGNAYITALEALYEKGAKAVFMCNEGVVKQVSDAVHGAGSKYDNIVFTGFDAGTKQISWIKDSKGAVLFGSVVQDAYSIGFNGAEQCIFAAEGKKPAGRTDIEAIWYDRHNIDSMIEKNLVYTG